MSLLENATIKELLGDLQNRVDEKILEPNNYMFLKKLLEKAESEDEMKLNYLMNVDYQEYYLA